MAEYDYLERRGMAGPMGQPEPISQPVAGNMATGSITPAPDTSGLYAIYGRRNPYSARAARLGALAGSDMGGRLGQLPGIVATALAGRAEKKAEEFEQTREADIKSFMARKEAYDKIKLDREASKQLFDESTKIMGIAGDKFNQILQETNGDFDRASKETDAWLKEVADAQGVPLPMVKGYARFKNSKVSMAVSKDGKEWLPIQLDEKTGVALAWDKAKETWGKIPEGYALLSDYAKVQQAQRPRGSGSSPEGMLEYYDANDNLVAKTKNQAEALAAGAVTAGRWVKYIDQTGNEAWKMEKVPLSRAPKKAAGRMENTQVQGQPPAPAKAAQVNIQQNRPNPVPGSPGSGQSPAPAPAAQPQMTEAQQAAAWIAANPNDARVPAIKAKYRLP